MQVTYSGLLAPKARNDAGPAAGVPGPVPTREQILRLQEAMLPVQCPMPEAVHHFAAGMYAREFSMPAGMVVVGKIHRHEHLMMVLRGRATVVDEFGRYEVAAGYIQTSRPGAKRVVRAHEDTTFVTVHLNPSNTLDLGQIEAEHIEPESAEMQALVAKHRLEALS
jgi:quercetin dioxygenase-like cupin family protein